MQEPQSSASLPFVAFAALATIIGIYARFKGLGFAPVSADEYYLARGIDGILKYGYPAYDCGGIYQRGLGLQYLIAGVRLTGLSIELSSRIVCAISSVALLPAVYLIARRVMSTNAALLAVGILALSVWQIEIARFGRMYAPFQAVFAWYLVYFLRYTVDRQTSALKAMLGLNVLGILVWEGSVFLALANFVAPLLSFIESRRLSRQDYLVVFCSVPLLIVAYLSATLNLRFTDVPPFPPDFTPDAVAIPQSFLEAVALPTVSTVSGVGWLLALLVIAGIAINALLWIWSRRDKPVAAAGLLVILITGLAHHFLLVVLVPVLLMLANQLSFRDFRSKGGLLFVLAIVLSLMFWIAYGAISTDWQTAIRTSGSSTRALISFVYQFVGFPNILGVIAKPFARAVPHLSLLLLVGLFLALVQTLRAQSQLRTPARVLLLLLTLLVLGVGLSDPAREETRYVAFLYPLVIILVVATITRLFAASAIRPMAASMLGSLVVFSLFAATEDIEYRHVAEIDSPRTTFRIGMNPSQEAHIEIRDDLKSIATWLEARAASPDVLVVTGVHGFDYYFKHAKYFFIDQQNPTFEEFSCRRGSVDRWTNLPLISTYRQLGEIAASYRKTYVVVFEPSAQERATLEDMHARQEMSEGMVVVIELGGKDAVP